MVQNSTLIHKYVEVELHMWGQIPEQAKLRQV